MNKYKLFLILISILTIIIAAQSFSSVIISNHYTSLLSPTSTSSSPTPTPTPACSGSATYTTTVRVPVDANKETIDKAIAEQQMNDPNLANFNACTYPTGFSCPDNCKVLFSEYTTNTITTPGASSSSDILKECNKAGTIRVLTFFSSDFGDLIQRAIIKLKDIIAAAIKECACPAGSATSVSVSINGASSVYDWFGRQVGIKLDYKINIKCLSKLSGTTSDADISITHNKHCVDKSAPQI